MSGFSFLTCFGLIVGAGALVLVVVSLINLVESWGPDRAWRRFARQYDFGLISKDGSFHLNGTVVSARVSIYGHRTTSAVPQLQGLVAFPAPIRPYDPLTSSSLHAIDKLADEIEIKGSELAWRMKASKSNRTRIQQIEAVPAILMEVAKMAASMDASP